MLEIVLDHFFYQESITEALDKLSQHVTHVVKKRWRSYEGAFVGRRIHISEAKLQEIEQRWFQHVPKTLAAANPTVFKIQSNADEAGFVDQINRAIKGFNRDGRYPKFELAFFSDREKDKHVAKALNSVFDGIVALPYSDDQRVRCLVNCLRLLPALEGDHDGIHAHEERVFGDEVISAEFAPWNAMHNAGGVTRRGLEEAIDPETVKSLRGFYRRMVEADKQKLLCVSLNHLHTLRFDALVQLFAHELIPSQFIWFLSEDLMQMEEGGAMWGVAFDPLVLHYFSLSRYQFEFPFALEQDLQHLMFLWDGMNDADIEEEIRSAESALKTTGSPFQLRLFGYEQDQRAVWQIPEAMKLLQTFYEAGGISLLEVSPQLMAPKDQSELNRHFQALGAFECWLMVTGKVGEYANGPKVIPQETSGEFLTDLMESNRRLEALTKAKNVFDSLSA